MKMNTQKRLLALLLAALMIVSFSACGKKPQTDTTAPGVDDSEPAVTEPIETEPTEVEPTETDPVETEPTETEPADTEPAETDPKYDPIETEPAETEPAETKPVDTEPAETKPAETEPVAEGCDHLYVRTVLEYPSCTNNGLEAMICTYCGETKKDAYFDDTAEFKGIISFEEPFFVGEATKDILAADDFYNTVFRPEENEMFWLNFTLKPVELSGFTTAEAGSTLLKFQVGKNIHRIMFRAYRVDEKSVKIMCQDSAGKSYELGEGAVLTEGETYNFVIEYEYETKKYNVYLNDEFIGGNAFQLDYGATEQYKLYIGSSGDWEFSNVEIVNSTHVYGNKYTEYGVIEAYGHTPTTGVIESPTLTHHQIEVTECERCEHLFGARGVAGTEHKFELLERVPDSETSTGYKVYGFETLKCEECGYILTVSSNHAEGHFYDVDIYTGKYECRCGSVLVEEFEDAFNGNTEAGALISGKGETNE